MRSDVRVRVLGGLIAAGAAPALLLDQPLGGMLAFACGVTGLFIAVVIPERTVPARAAESLLDGAAAELADVVRGLHLEGRPVYVHDQGNVGEERVFIPASVNARPVPVLDADTVTYTGAGATKIGLAVHAPGIALVSGYEAATGARVKDAPLEDVAAFLGGLARANDLAGGLDVTRDADRIRVRFKRGAVSPPCFRDPGDPACLRTGCALCQAAGCAFARSLGRPVEVTDADVAPPRVTLTYRPVEDGA